MKSLSRVRFFATLWAVANQPPLCGGKNTGVGCYFLLQGIFLTQESNPGLLHCRQILYQLSYKENLCNPLRFEFFPHNLLGSFIGSLPLDTLIF